MSTKRGRKCSIKSCDNFQHTHKHLSFFRYPKDVARCRLWIDKTKRFDLLDKINVHDERICQQHFEPTMFLNENQNRLQQFAIPTKYLLTKPPPIEMSLVDLSKDDDLYQNAKFNMDTVDKAAALLFQNNLTITPVYSSKPKSKVGASEPLNLSSSSQNGTGSFENPYQNAILFNSSRNSILLNSSSSSNGSSNCSMQQNTTISIPAPSYVPTPRAPPAHTLPTYAPPTNAHLTSASLTNAPLTTTTLLPNTLPTNGIQMPAFASNHGGSRRPRQVFSVEQENELADYVRETSNYYSGLSSKEVRILAFVYGVCNSVEMPVGWRESHQASFDWCVGFIKRTKLPPSMVTSMSTKGSGKQSKSSNANSGLNTNSISSLNTNANISLNNNSNGHKAIKEQQVNGSSTKSNNNVIPIEID